MRHAIALVSPFTTRVDVWPSLFVAWIIVCIHYTIAVALPHAPEARNLFIFNGLQVIPDSFSPPTVSIVLAVISTMTMISLLGEYRMRWQFLVVLMLPQYLLVLYGVGSDLAIIITGGYRGQEFDRWFIIAGINAFLWMGIWHTIAIVTRIRYWMLLSQSRSQY